uniref:Tumor protein p53-inducible protein 11 n=1 Tax=Biomphalaria glabrata TaxID=6526 RepID=A0A2C9KCE4_BIOGL
MSANEEDHCDPLIEDYSPPPTPSSVVEEDKPKEAPSVVNQFLKLLLRKHSSGDLHSRLKTRKLLGVGETDDGDIHRSKLSQILGHSDQLYIRLPYGLRIWQLLIAIMFTFYGLWALVLPSHILNTTLEVSGADDVILPVRLYGCALVSLSIVYWMTLSTQDRDIIRMCLMTSIVYFGVQFIVTAWHTIVSPEPITRNVIILMCFRGSLVLISWFYHWALIQRKFFSMKRSASCKDLSKEK